MARSNSEIRGSNARYLAAEINVYHHVRGAGPSWEPLTLVLALLVVVYVCVLVLRPDAELT